MYEEPITTVQQAKEFFKAMGCSYFHMDREFPERSREYRNLNISKQTEAEWQKEEIEKDYVNITENNSNVPIWNLHSRMYDLFDELKTSDTLITMLNATRHIRDTVPLIDRIIVAETINGRQMRQFRSGLIYSAYDLGNIAATKEFIELSLHFSKYDEKENRGIARCQGAANLCNDIRTELGL